MRSARTGSCFKPAQARRRRLGFTLIELVVVIAIIGILAAIAMPRFAAAEREARIASVNQLAGALRSTASTVKALCMVTAPCDSSAASWTGTLDGRGYWLNYGYPDAGDELAGRQIDGQLTYSGFTASIVTNASTLFAHNGAPNPATCSVQYFDAWFTPPIPRIVVQTAGC